MFHALASDRSGFEVSVCSMFKHLIGLVLKCAYVPCLSVG